MNFWFVCATTPFLCKPDYIPSHSRSHILTPVTPKHLLSIPISASPTRCIHQGKFIHSGREQTIILYVYNTKAQIESYKYPNLTTDSRPALVLAGDGWVEIFLLSSTRCSSLVLPFWRLLGYTAWHTKVLVTTKTAHLMPQTRQTTGSHLPHCTPGFNLTISPKGSMTPKLAIKG